MLAAASFALFLIGCGGSGPSRYELKGKVTFGGLPVKAGTIYFDPDTSKGNSGPQASGPIRDGEYKTNPNFGVIGGPHIVRIIGYDGKRPDGPEGEMLPHGRVLFSEYQTVKDIPKGAASVDFDVPPTGK